MLSVSISQQAVSIVIYKEVFSVLKLGLIDVTRGTLSRCGQSVGRLRYCCSRMHVFLHHLTSQGVDRSSNAKTQATQIRINVVQA